MTSWISRRGLGLGLAILPAACATVQTATPAPSAEQPPVLHQRLTPIARFVGRWRGTTEGEPGRGTVERTYTPILNGRFIEERNTSTYPPQPNSMAGEIHHHLAFGVLTAGARASCSANSMSRASSISSSQPRRILLTTNFS